MVGGIHGDGGLTPSQKKVLNDEYKEAAKGFQAALDKFNTMDGKPQKHECKKVMHQYMNVMNHVAADLRKEKLLSQTSELEADLNVLDKDDSATAKLQSDLDKLK